MEAKTVSDAKYFKHLATVLALRENLTFEQAVYRIQRQFGEEWGMRNISLVFGISMDEADQILSGALKKLNRAANGYGLKKNGQMIMFEADPIDLEDYGI